MRLHWRHHFIWLSGYALLAAGGCAPSSLVEVDAPNTVIDEAQVQTPAGALEMYNAGVRRFREVFATQQSFNIVGASGLFTDELMYAQGSGGHPQGFNSRIVSYVAPGHFDW